MAVVADQRADGAGKHPGHDWDAQAGHDLVRNQVIALLAGGDLDGCPGGPRASRPRTRRMNPAMISAAGHQELLSGEPAALR